MPVCFCSANAPDTTYGTLWSFISCNTSRNSAFCSFAKSGAVDELTGNGLSPSFGTDPWMNKTPNPVAARTVQMQQACRLNSIRSCPELLLLGQHPKKGMPRTESFVEIEGRRLKLSNLQKVLYPDAGFTKAQVIDYYVRIAPALLPHLRGRPLTMKRYPEGVNGQFFYEKNCPKHRPDWVQTAEVWSAGNNRWMSYCMVQDLATLVWAANLADIELHTSLSMASEMLRPTMIVFDLDPGPPANIVQCCQVGLWV